MNKVKDERQRQFYLQKTAENGWSKAVLTQQIESGLHVRLGAITKLKDTKPKPQRDLARDGLKIPCVFDVWDRERDAGAGRKEISYNQAEKIYARVA